MLQRIILSKRFHRLYATTSAGVPLQLQNALPRKPRARKATAETKLPTDMSSYFNKADREGLLKSMPAKLLKKKIKSPPALYLASSATARIIADALKENLAPGQSLIEVNPGLGLISKHLAKEVDNDIQLFEPYEGFHANLLVTIRVSHAIHWKLMNLISGHTQVTLARIRRPQANRLNDALAAFVHRQAGSGKSRR